MSKFRLHQHVLEVSTGKYYFISGVPDYGYRLERTNEPAYLYRASWVNAHGAPEGIDPNDHMIWIRSQTEMEGGRFVLV